MHSADVATIFPPAQQSTRAHRLLCELPFLVHITTNSDSLVEDTLRSLQYPVHLVADSGAVKDWSETREVQGYDMVPAKSGLKLTPAQPGSSRGGSGRPGSITLLNMVLGPRC